MVKQHVEILIAGMVVHKDVATVGGGAGDRALSNDFNAGVQISQMHRYFFKNCPALKTC